MRFQFCLVLTCLGVISAVAEDSTENSTMIAEAESAIVSQTNDYRESKSLSPVSVDANLTDTAKQFARFMAKTGEYGHHADGRTPAERAKATGYQYCVVRENIAYRTNNGEVTADSLIEVFVQGWIDSPPHRENMLADYVTETGVGVSTNDAVTYYAVQLFGRPKSAAFRVEVSNRSEQVKTIVVQSKDSEDEFDLPPQSTVRMKRCFPTTLMTNQGGQKVTVQTSAKFVVDDKGLKAAED